MEKVLLFLPVLVFSIVVHEVAHGWVALRNGDDTAAQLGRLTLNPIPHIDPFGSVIVPVMLALMPGGLMFGWAKPVPVDSSKFRNYKRADILVSLAGIASNLLLAIGFTLLTILFIRLGRGIPSMTRTFQLLVVMTGNGVWVNLILAFFNLIPIPPLDGSHVMYHLLPPRLGAHYRQLGRFGFLIVMAMVFYVPRAQSIFLWPAMQLGGLAQALIQFWT